jgi:hypothetical protein
MQINSKSDNDRFTLFPDGTLHLYDNLHEVAREDHTEYEGELYITRTELTQSEVEAQFDSLLATEREKWQKHVAKAEAEKAQKYLNDTDWVVAQLGEYQMLGIELPDRSDILQQREDARQKIREYRNAH